MMLDDLLLRASLLLWRVATTLSGSFYPSDPETAHAFARWQRQVDEDTDEWMREQSREQDEKFQEWVHRDPMDY